MTENRVKKKNLVLAIACTMLLLGSLFLYLGTGSKISVQRERTVTIGCFSDSYWEVPNGYSYQILEDAIRLFEDRYPGVKVEYVSGILKEDYSEWLSGQILSGTAPDLFFVLGEDFNDFVQTGILKDLTPLLRADEQFQQEGFFSSALEYGKYEKRQYSLPYECAPKLMFVNKSILNREGLELPKEQWTWDDFYEICKKVTKDTDGNGTTDQFGAVNYTWEEAFESNGVSVFNQDGTECFLTGDGAEEALVFIDQLKELNGGYHVTEKDFDLGNVVFQPMSFSQFRAYKPYPLSVKKYSGFEWECIPMPAGPRGENISTLDTLLLAMNEKTKNADDAWEFMKILTCDAQIQSEIFRYSEGVSVLRSVTESDETLQQLIDNSEGVENLNVRILSDAVEHAVVGPKFRNLEGAKAEVDKAVDAITGANISISMEQIIWNREVNQYLENNR